MKERNASLREQAKELAKLWGGFRAARVVLTANNYGVFEYVKSAKTADEIAGILGTDKRATEILLDAVTSLGLLKKTGNGYQNTPLSNQFLIKGKPYYQGDMIRHADALWKNWSGLDEVLKTGLPNRTGSRNYEVFVKAMHNNAVLRAGEVISAIDLRGVKKALDLGGGPGSYCVELAKKKISVTLFDLSDAIKIAKGIIQQSGAKNIDYLEGDFHTDDIGRGYDLIFVSQVFHSYAAGDNIAILNKVQKALNPKGQVAIHEFYLERNRAFPPSSALFSVNMLVNTSSGRCYTPQEMKKWLIQAGFKDIKEKRINDTIVVSARKK